MKNRREIIKLLKQSGFVREDTNHYISDTHSVELHSDSIAIADSMGNEIFAPLNYYAMVGLLVTHKVI